MNHENNHANSTAHGSYERHDISIAAVVYFLVALAVSGVLIYFIAEGIFWYLDRHFAAEQPAVSPIVTNVPKDTRHLPPQYNNDYVKYLHQSFPAPQLEVNEQTELNSERLREEDTLSTYDYVDQKAGIIRIPIDRAMDILAQRGLPVRQPGAATAANQPDSQQKTKGTKK